MPIMYKINIESRIIDTYSLEYIESVSLHFF